MFINWIGTWILAGNFDIPLFLEMLKQNFVVEHASAIVLLFVVLHIFAHPFNELRKRVKGKLWRLEDCTLENIPPYDQDTILDEVDGPFDEEAIRGSPFNILRDGANPTNTNEIEAIQQFLEQNTRYLHRSMDKSWGVARVGNSFGATAGMGRALQTDTVNNNLTPPNGIMGDTSHRPSSSPPSSGGVSTVERGESDDLMPANVLSAMLKAFAKKNPEVAKKKKEKDKEKEKEKRKEKKEKEETLIKLKKQF
jgi:hypothetical protein